MCVLHFLLFGSAIADDPRAVAERLVKAMTLGEKLRLLQGNATGGYANMPWVGIVNGVPRLGVPDLRMNDGPQGYRALKQYSGTSTQWPSGLTAARTWDGALLGAWGAAMGAEFAGKGANVLFGPALNVARIANGGRSFEYLSGEDPLLGHVLVQPLVKGIQDAGIIANAKHFIDNAQEGLLRPGETPLPGGTGGDGDRHRTSSEVDERTQRQLYFPPFEGAAAAGVLSYMCADNLVNGRYACEDRDTMLGMLKGPETAFRGWVCSDYDGTRSTVGAANAGLDLAMPGPPITVDFFGAPLRAAVLNGSVALDAAAATAAGLPPLATIDEKATRIVFSMAALGMLDGGGTAANGTVDANVTSTAHTALARKLAAAAVVLLTNRPVAPLPTAVSATEQQSVQQGRTEERIAARPLLPLPAGGGYSMAVIGEAADGAGAIFGGGGSGRVAPKHAVSILEGLRARLGDARVSFSSGSGSGGAAAAVAAAAAADVAIVVLAATSAEGKDRSNLTLAQSELVAPVASANTRTVVVTVTPGPFLTHFLGNGSAVAALLDMGLPGEQEGHALADVLFGDENPAGRLPHTLPNSFNEQGLSTAQYPGTPPRNGTGAPKPCTFHPDPSPGGGGCVCSPTVANFSEGMLTGYRWYDAHGVVPAIPFGHGLSYTTFDYSELVVEGRVISATIKNTGAMAGAEVVQLYLRYPDAAGEPFKQLRGFQKLTLEPGANAVVRFELSERWLSTWNVDAHTWALARGTFIASVGASIGDIRLSANFTV